MYHNNPWGHSSSSEPSFSANNPFSESSASNRFPALDQSTSQPSFQYQSPYPSTSPSPSYFQQPSPYGMQQNMQQYPQWNGQPQQPQSPSHNQGGFAAYPSPQQQYQSTGSGSYGQGQQATYGGQLQPQPQLQQQYTGYMQYPQSPVSPQQHQQSVISQFDPYSGSSGNTSGWNGQSQNQNQGGNVMHTGPSGQSHPRTYIQSHKVELESWNAGVWKQALSTFEELKRAWERRRQELQKHLISGQYLTAEDITSVNGMIKSSESNIDSVTASLIQMQEVNSGYKHSLDAASKRRVREVSRISMWS
ncbi:hypothetical protein K439DRAFT_1612388 [Ramaria rubella]|nr:hypothetical protein K439DRAFT_1612388 [Ramaria rubella]